MNADIRSIVSQLAGLTWIGLRSFLVTLFLLTLAGIVLAGVSFFFLNHYHWYYGLIGASIALTEAVTTGFFLGIKRAIALTLAHALGALHLGRSLVRLIFERMLGVADGQQFGERGGSIAQGIERLPLAQAEAELSAAIRQITGDAEQSGWLARKVQTRLLDAVRKYTLARFRAQDAKHGGIDLLQMKEQLEQSIDVTLVDKIRGGLRSWMIGVILGLPLLVAAQTGFTMLLLHAMR